MPRLWLTADRAGAIVKHRFMASVAASRVAELVAGPLGTLPTGTT